jgi:uncharacterized protein (DUF302 family)
LSGVQTVVSSSGHAETLRRLLGAITGHGLTVFAQFDHAAGAREVGLEMADEVAIAFGNPRSGTPLMQADPRIGIELPLRMLVWDAGGETLVGYNDPRDLARSYDVGSEASRLEAMASLLDGLAHEAAAV